MMVEYWGFKVVTKLIKHFESLYGFCELCLNITQKNYLNHLFSGLTLLKTPSFLSLGLSK